MNKLLRTFYLYNQFGTRARSVKSIISSLKKPSVQQQPTEKDIPTHEKQTIKTEQSNSYIPKKEAKREELKQTAHVNLQKKKYYENEKQKKKLLKRIPPSETRFLQENEIKNMIYSCKSHMEILKVYNSHKFTYTQKLLLLTIYKLAIHYQKYTKENKIIQSNQKIKQDDTRVASLLYNLQESLNTYQISELIIIAWSLTHLKFDVSDIFTKTIDQIFRELKYSNLRDCSFIGWIMAKNNIRDSQKYGKLSLHITQNLNKPQENDQNENENLLENLEEFEENGEEIEDLIDLKEKIIERKENKKFDEQSISLIIWAFGKSKMRDDELIEKLFEFIQEKSYLFSGRQIVNILAGLQNVEFKLNLFNMDSILNQSLKNIKIEEESILTFYTLITLLGKIDSTQNLKVENFMISFSEYIFKRNEKGISAKFSTNIFRSLMRKEIYNEELLIKILENQNKSIQNFNVTDTISSLMNWIKLRHIYKKLSKSHFLGKIHSHLDLLFEKLILLQHKLNKNELTKLWQYCQKNDYISPELDKLFKRKGIKL